MTQERVIELIGLGFDEEWVRDVQENFNPKVSGKYSIKIFDCEELDQEPETGIFVGTYFFDNDRDLSVIHHFFEGLFCVMNVVQTNEELGRGIVDGAPFDEMMEFEGSPWDWMRGEDLGWNFTEREEARKEQMLKHNRELSASTSENEDPGITVNELIEMLKAAAGGENPRVKFVSYEWDDDLEGLSYHKRWFEKVARDNGKVVIQISR